MFGFGKKIRPAEAKDRVKKAEELRKAGRMEEALAVYDELRRLFPDDRSVVGARANVLWDMGRKVEALGEYNRALAMGGNYYTGLVNRAAASRELGDLVGAIEDWKAAFEMQPDRSILLYRMANARQAMSDHQGMLEDALLYQERFPEQWVGFFLAGIAYRHLERWEECLATFARMQSMRKGPPHHVPYWHSSFAYEGLGRMQDALEAAETAMRFGPNDPVPPQRRAELLMKMGRSEEAKEFFQGVHERQEQFVREVAGRGKFVWARVIQANSTLFEKGENDSAATVVFTFDREVPELGKALVKLAAWVASFKNKRIDDPMLAELGYVTTNEHPADKRVRVPATMCGGREFYCQTLKVYRRYLRIGYLDGGFLACTADVGAEGRVAHLPWSVGEKKVGLLGIM